MFLRQKLTVKIFFKINILYNLVQFYVKVTKQMFVNFFYFKIKHKEIILLIKTECKLKDSIRAYHLVNFFGPYFLLNIMQVQCMLKKANNPLLYIVYSNLIISKISLFIIHFCCAFPKGMCSF